MGLETFSFLENFYIYKFSFVVYILAHEPETRCLKRQISVKKRTYKSKFFRVTRRKGIKHCDTFGPGCIIVWLSCTLWVSFGQKNVKRNYIRNSGYNGISKTANALYSYAQNVSNRVISDLKTGVCLCVYWCVKKEIGRLAGKCPFARHISCLAH